MVVALIEFAIIIVMGRVSARPYNKVECTTMSKKKAIRQSLFASNKGKNTDRKGLSGIHPQLENERVQVLMGKDGNWYGGSTTINAIDFASFWLFLIFFFLFNIAYWKSY